jgi:hypothetical protein
MKRTEHRWPDCCRMLCDQILELPDKTCSHSYVAYANSQDDCVFTSYLHNLVLHGIYPQPPGESDVSE